MSKIFSEFKPEPPPEENKQPEKPERKERAKPEKPVEATTAPPRKSRKIKKPRKPKTIAAPQPDTLSELLALGPAAIQSLAVIKREIDKFDAAKRKQILALLA